MHLVHRLIQTNICHPSGFSACEFKGRTTTEKLFWWGSISLPTTFWHSHTFPLKNISRPNSIWRGNLWLNYRCPWVSLHLHRSQNTVHGCGTCGIHLRCCEWSIWQKAQNAQAVCEILSKKSFLLKQGTERTENRLEPFVELWCFTNHTFKQRWSHAGSLSWCHLCQVAPVHFEQWENAINQMATKYPKLNGNLSRIVQRHDLIHSNCRIFELFDMFMFCVCNMNIGRKRKVALADLPHQTIVEVDHPPNHVYSIIRTSAARNSRCGRQQNSISRLVNFKKKNKPMDRHWNPGALDKAKRLG